jgi:hypothetical protein
MDNDALRTLRLFRPACFDESEERRVTRVTVPVHRAKRVTDEPQRLRHIAMEMRRRARDARLPDYSDLMLDAAEGLERRACELDAQPSNAGRI